MTLELPVEVRDFLTKAEIFRQPQLRINPLSPEAALDYSACLRTQVLGTDLGFIALDDADDSNPYCYMETGVARGMIVHLRHDGEPRVAFQNLNSLHNAFARLTELGLDIDELAAETKLLHADQEALAEAFSQYCVQDDDEAVFCICLLLPLLSSNEFKTLETLANSNSLFIREAVAEHLSCNPSPHARALAQHLANDSSAQVRSAAKEALRAIRDQSAAN